MQVAQDHQLDDRMGSHQMNQVSPHEDRIVETLKKIPAGLNVSAINPLAGGSNNRVLLLHTQGGEKLVAKLYYRHSGDERDRLRSEFDFLEFAMAVGIRNVPRPVYRDTTARIGIYSHIDGTPVTSQDLAPGLVEEAARLFDHLNRNRSSPQAEHLPQASEACFSIAQHIAVVDRRLERLGRIHARDDIDEKAVCFVNQLREAWSGARRKITDQSGQSTASLTQELDDGSRCLSPSDFGFHNAIRTGHGIAFIDFEYAGWDDPAKMIADFFCQPAIPVSTEYFELFTSIALSAFEDKAEIIARANMLLPMYRIKWCCIMLNEFLPSSMNRRAFAYGNAQALSRKEQQLNKAENSLKYLNL